MKVKGTRTDHFGAEAKGKETTRDERLQILTLRDKGGMTWKEIEAAMGIDYRTCQKIYARVQITGTPSNRKRKGRPMFFTEEEKQRLIAFITRDRFTRRLSWEDIREKMSYDCSANTIRNVVASMGYHKRVPRRKWGVREANKVKRVEWCQARLHWTEEEWERVIWTDESMYNTIGFSQRPWVIRRADEEFHPDCIDLYWESGRETVMVWGAFCGEHKSELVACPSGIKLDSCEYTLSILDPHLIPFWHKMCEEYGWAVVVEDGGPGHKGYSKACRALNNMDVLEWPPQSPDLNLIEALWGDIAQELGHTYGRISGKDTLLNLARMEWLNIGAARLRSLISSMPNRLQAVIAANGAATPY